MYGQQGEIINSSVNYYRLCLSLYTAGMGLYVALRDNFYRKIYKKKEAINLVVLAIDGRDEHRGMKTLI
jgi:hypothetical protein